jgi:periplasmic protein TonB
MSGRRALWSGALLGALACGRAEDGTVPLTPGGDAAGAPDVAEEAPVAVNPVSPVVYPQPLRDQGVEGRVLLRLYADSQGILVPDSTRVAESSGYPALDSAAVAGSAELKYSPALRRGRPVAGLFFQPVNFRNPRSRSAVQ